MNNVKLKNIEFDDFKNKLGMKNSSNKLFHMLKKYGGQIEEDDMMTNFTNLSCRGYSWSTITETILEVVEII